MSREDFLKEETPQSQPEQMPNRSGLSRRNLIILVILLIIGVVELMIIVWKLNHDSANNTSNSQTSSNTQSFNKSKFSVDQASSMWVVVNKGRILPSTYVPADLVVPAIPLRTSAPDQEMNLRSDAAKAIETMFTDAEREGIKLRLTSGYRSYSEQVSVYASEVKNNGQTMADRESARPGHSEHQTGLAADLEPFNRSCEINDCFADTPEGKWLAANSYRYGFIIRYQKNNETLTGYRYEPWHVRYVGSELSNKINKSNQTLEQFFGLPIYTDYPAKSFSLI